MNSPLQEQRIDRIGRLISALMVALLAAYFIYGYVVSPMF